MTGRQAPASRIPFAVSESAEQVIAITCSVDFEDLRYFTAAFGKPCAQLREGFGISPLSIEMSLLSKFCGAVASMLSEY